MKYEERQEEIRSHCCAHCSKTAVAFVSYIQEWEDIDDILWECYLCFEHLRQFPTMADMARA